MEQAIKEMQDKMTSLREEVDMLITTLNILILERWDRRMPTKQERDEQKDNGE